MDSTRHSVTAWRALVAWCAPRCHAGLTDSARLTAYVTPCFYFGPHFEFSTIVDLDQRARVRLPTDVLWRFTTGGEF